jgi:YNFM family putative membrane transporter
MRVTLALFSAGLATFALLYCVQPILPVLSHEFGVSPPAAAFRSRFQPDAGGWPALYRPLSDAIGRKQVMVTALMLASVLYATLDHDDQLARHPGDARADWASLSGVAAVGMTYLSEEIHPSFVAFSMGLYISGNSIGGMSGRLLSGVFTDFFSWRIALAVIGCLRWHLR